MHPNPAFRQMPPDRNIAFARAQGFGVLAVGTDAAPLISHIPFLLNDTGTEAEFHLVRSNPICRLVGQGEAARLAVQGPHGYISPDWYGVADQVPTWNYVAVHLVGRVEPLPQDALHPMLDRLSAHFESGLAPKPEWHSAKMDAEIMARMMRQILPFRMVVEDVQGTWKLGQNKPEAARLGAADGLDALGQSPLAALMRNPPDS